ncbi:MAG: carboxymuconolactone decarboxylase family protein [Actinomycetota bacterium]
MVTPRVAPLSADDSKTAAEHVGIVKLKAGLSIYRVLLRQPQLAQRISDLTDELTANSSLDARLREMIIMRIGWLNNGVYEWTQHWQLAPLFGVDQADLLAIRDWERHDRWSAADRAALHATDETVRAGVISNDTWAECAAAFPTEQSQLDLVATIGVWKMLSELLQNVAVPLDDGLDAWPPDGVAPHHDVATS